MWKFKRKHLTYLLRDIPLRKKLKVLEWIIRQHKLWGPFPLYAKIEIDSRCNLKCEMCQRTKIVDNSYLSMEQFQEIVTKLGPGLCDVHVHGYGESLLNPHYFEMMEWLKQKGILFGLVTNGTLLDTDEKRRRLLKLRPTVIQFSIDAADKETYERIRKGANFEKVRENFMELVKIREELYLIRDRNTPQLNLYNVLTMNNLDQIGPMIELKDEWGADILAFSDLAWNNQFGTSTFDLCVRENMRASEVDKLLKPYRKRKDVVFHLKNDAFRSCDYPALHSYIDVTGKIYPCTCTPGADDDLGFGYIWDIEDIKEVYQSQVYNEFREKSRLGQLDGKSCRRCLQWGVSIEKL